MKKFQLQLMGCDDSTEIDVVLTDDELDFCLWLQTKFNEFSGGCCPSFYVIGEDGERE